jgi:N-methylhydantoinase B/oxoprolinase/acetone carboxylase alpha subunit
LLRDVLSESQWLRLPSKATFSAAAGERIVIETPGGGGYSDPAARDPQLIEEDLRGGLLSAGYLAGRVQNTKPNGGRKNDAPI